MEFTGRRRSIAGHIALGIGLISILLVLYIGYFLLYLASRRTAHRLVGYFEEEAVLSYTLYLDEIEGGRMPNPPAPAIAQRYWTLGNDATLADVVRAVRADEALHRDVNHGLANALRPAPAA